MGRQEECTVGPLGREERGEEVREGGGVMLVPRDVV
jgi:hypothetical protein